MKVRPEKNLIMFMILFKGGMKTEEREEEEGMKAGRSEREGTKEEHQLPGSMRVKSKTKQSECGCQ